MKLRACCCCSMTFSWVVAPILKETFPSRVYRQILLSNSSFKQLIITAHQPTRNLHSYIQLTFAVIFPPRSMKTKFVSTHTVNDQLFRCFGPSSRQICQLHYQAPVLNEVSRQLQVFQASLWMNVASPNIWIKCKFCQISPCLNWLPDFSPHLELGY